MEEGIEFLYKRGNLTRDIERNTGVVEQPFAIASWMRSLVSSTTTISGSGSDGSCGMRHLQVEYDPVMV
jgi:hypothetical protein